MFQAKIVIFSAPFIERLNALGKVHCGGNDLHFLFN